MNESKEPAPDGSHSTQCEEHGSQGDKEPHPKTPPGDALAPGRFTPLFPIAIVPPRSAHMSSETVQFAQAHVSMRSMSVLLPIRLSISG